MNDEIKKNKKESYIWKINNIINYYLYLNIILNRLSN